jgi:hypothetical protein
MPSIETCRKQAKLLVRWHREHNYGSVSRDGACLHLRFVHQTNFSELAARERSLILATMEVANVKALFQEYEARSVDFAQRLVRQAASTSTGAIRTGTSFLRPSPAQPIMDEVAARPAACIEEQWHRERS